MNLDELSASLAVPDPEFQYVDFSYKDAEHIWFKPGGVSCANHAGNSFIDLSRNKIRMISRNDLPADPVEREKKIRKYLAGSATDVPAHEVPSGVLCHELMNSRYVLHLRTTIINGLMCSRNARNQVKNLFGDKALFIQYSDPGYSLFRKIESELAGYRQKFTEDPALIFLENNGCLISAGTLEDIKRLSEEITARISEYAPAIPDVTDLPFNPAIGKIVPVLRMLLSGEKPVVVRSRHNTLIEKYYQNQQDFHKVSLPLTPETIIRCRTRFMFIEHSHPVERILDSFRYQLPNFVNEYGYFPAVVVIKGMGALAFAENYVSAERTLDAFENHLKVSHLAFQSGGLRYLTPEQAKFIDNSMEKCRVNSTGYNNLENKIVLITGGMDGFGPGIIKSLFEMGLNIALADADTEKAAGMISGLPGDKTNRALHVPFDIKDPDSVRSMILSVVREFGGIDILINNMEIQESSLEEMDDRSLETLISMNYKGYFLSTKYVSEIMKLQNQGKPGYFSDIIRIASRRLSGNRNKVISGMKSAGMELTRDFAMELAPYRIKVNSIIPGNNYDNPVWSDPREGLFVHYLKTGHVPGARSVEDVKQYFQDQVPLKRGCTLRDLMKAILYVIDQEYETGQTMTVSGGQMIQG